MKNHVSKIIHLSLFAIALLALPVLIRAEDANTNAAPVTDQSAPAKPKAPATIPFHGKLKAVDAGAMTLTVGTRTFEVTAATKIFNNGEPATLADGKVGEPVRGTYLKNDNGKL